MADLQRTPPTDDEFGSSLANAAGYDESDVAGFARIQMFDSAGNPNSGESGYGNIWLPATVDSDFTEDNWNQIEQPPQRHLCVLGDLCG
ncbi:MAG: hypothetical protein Rhob2KO_51330 [Rhodopirellula baltica]